MKQFLDNIANLQNNIASDVWPDGWSGKCRICGKPFHYTKNECGYYLAHGWPKCDHKPSKKNCAAPKDGDA